MEAIRSDYIRSMQKGFKSLRKMRIGILGTRGIPNNYGGFEQFAEYLSVGLVQRGHEVYVYNSSRHPYRERKWNGVNIIHCTDPEHRIGTFGQFIYDLNCINDSRKRNFDVLLHLGYTSDSVWHRRWPEDIVNIVNVDGFEWKRSKYNKPTRLFLKWAESLAAKNAEVLVADSLHIQEHFQRQYNKKPAYIPYGASVFNEADPSVPLRYNLIADQYFLVVARMEPENNIEMIIRGYMAAKPMYPLLIVGNIQNNYGTHLRKKFNVPGIRFFGSVYNQPELNNLRYFSAKYFHGHSVGGTNPSLLEAMACGCNIAAHNNMFNKAVLSNDADYFSSAADVEEIISIPSNSKLTDQRRESNIEKILTVYSQEKNIDDYEQIMLSACVEKQAVTMAVIAGQAVPADYHALRQTGETHL